MGFKIIESIFSIFSKSIGFDISGADSDGSDPGPAGARDVQSSWDTEVADNPDNAWFHRNVIEKL